MNQTNRLLFVLLFSISIAMLFAGCATEPSQQSVSESAEQVPVKEENTSTDKTPRGFTSDTQKLCQTVTEQELKDQIRKLPNKLTRQFDEGNISMLYADKTLVFKGYVHGNGNNFRALLNGFDKFRSKDCVRQVLFQGDKTPNFEWRPDPDFVEPTPPGDCKADLVKELDKSLVKEQLNKNLYYNYNEQTRILEFRGAINDPSGKNRFNSLISQLQRLMTNGCIKKVIFDGKIVKTFLQIPDGGFGWNLCEAGMCECNGTCVACPCSES